MQHWRQGRDPLSTSSSCSSLKTTISLLNQIRAPSAPPYLERAMARAHNNTPACSSSNSSNTPDLSPMTFAANPIPTPLSSSATLASSHAIGEAPSQEVTPASTHPNNDYVIDIVAIPFLTT